MIKNSHADGPEFPKGSIVNLARKQHPSNKPISDSEVTETYWDERQECWMHTVKFRCDRMPNSFPHGFLKLAKEPK